MPGAGDTRSPREMVNRTTRSGTREQTLRETSVPGPSRQAAGKKPATRNPPIDEDDEEDEPERPKEPDLDAELEQERAELMEAVRRRRKIQEIEALRQELDGEDPSVDVQIEGVSLPFRKRRRNSSDPEETRERAFIRSLKMSDCPTFHGKTQRELQNFNIGWKNIFRGREDVDPQLWTERINMVGQRLRGDAAVAWNRNDEKYTSWAQFISWLRTTLADPAVRMAEALQTLYRFNQGEHQKVRELLIEIERLEEDIPEMTEEVRKAWILLLAVKPEIRTSVLSEHKEITSRDQVLASASRHEQALALEVATKPRSHRQETRHETRHEVRHETHATRTPHPPRAQERSSTSSTQAAATPRRVEEIIQTRSVSRTPDITPATASTPMEKVQCYNCKLFGHFSTKCPGGKAGGAYPASGANATTPQMRKKS